jgi:hypothetical protein
MALAEVRCNALTIVLRQVGASAKARRTWRNQSKRSVDPATRQ